ncbi:hypothetical protein HUK65_12430 [Rhodobacteraceae bacterium 2376]|uniref:Uncharacterized protein n=1 Tax=Rhabdonatronobacter sediminivivens TaxID=2743469 RepID=A0A7Z0I0Q6_9RHOB|nr:hypothetical protein [Rhabdonatronobacter sediminivivens]NYS25800.1 hypothetical protein [Rhabdonatronobacter sediminivivens]
MIRPMMTLAVALVPLPVLAQSPCLPLGAQVALCAEGTPWAEARALPLDDDFVSYEAPPLYLEASTSWITPGEAGTPEAALSALEAALAEDTAAEGAPLPLRRGRETVTTDHATITYDVFIEVDAGEAFPLAVMVLEDQGGWLTLMLSSDTPMEEDRFMAEADSLARLLRPAPEG